MKKVTVGVILFGTKYLKESLPSLINQDYPNIEFIFHDQEEGKWSAAEIIEKEMPEVAGKVALSREKNLWHSGGHNAIIRKMTGDYYFCLSNDMLYPKDFVSKMMQALEANPECSFATPKILRWDYKNKTQTTQIDSIGLACTSYHHFYDIGHGEEDKGQYDEIKHPWGVSGAAAVLSKEALESIKFFPEETVTDSSKHQADQPQYFDERMHYKNDVDLSFRLSLKGQKALLVQDVIVYHDRQAAKNTKKSLFTKRNSFIGEKILMQKNVWGQPMQPGRSYTQTIIYHFLKTAYLLATTPGLWKEYLHHKR